MNKSHKGRWSLRKKGQTLALLVIALPAFIGAIGLAADVGNFYYNYYKLQTAVDAAVLAGAKCLPSGQGCNGTCGTGSASSCTPAQTATYFATTNGVQASDTVTGPTISGGNTTVAMTVARNVPYYFARVVGMDHGTMNVSATAETGPAGSVPVSNLLPIGLQYCLPSMTASPCPYAPGTTAFSFAAQENNGKSAWSTGPGDWSALSLPATGSVSTCAPPAGTCITSDPGFAKIKHIIDNLINDPSTGICAQGNAVDPSGTASSHTANDPRAVTVPMVDWTGCNGNCPLNVFAFAELWINCPAIDGGPKGSSINATFITQSINGEIGGGTGGGGDVGTNAIKLIQ